MMDLKKLANQYKDELMNNVLPFWLDHSQDTEYGGYFTCLDREGIFSTRINLSGCKVGKYGCSPCFTIGWRSVRSGLIVPFRVVSS